jgi:hypothetical protein
MRSIQRMGSLVIATALAAALWLVAAVTTQ